MAEEMEVPKVDLPEFSSRHLSTFEGVFLSEEQVKKCETMFATGVKSSNPFFLAWKAFKVASLSTEKEALEAVLTSHAPSNIPKRKSSGGRKVPDGAGRFNPISAE